MLNVLNVIAGIAILLCSAFAVVHSDNGSPAYDLGHTISTIGFCPSSNGDIIITCKRSRPNEDEVVISAATMQWRQAVAAAVNGTGPVFHSVNEARALHCEPPPATDTYWAAIVKGSIDHRDHPNDKRPFLHELTTTDGTMRANVFTWTDAAVPLVSYFYSCNYWPVDESNLDWVCDCVGVGR